MLGISVERISHAVRDSIRGYSDKDLTETNRLASGVITPEDLENFRIAEASRLAIGLSSSSLGLNEIAPLVVSEVHRLRNTPDEILATLVQSAARQKLSSWRIQP